MTWNSSPAAYPKTPAQARRQGFEDHLAGYPITWAPNLGPRANDPKFIEAWEAGWQKGEMARLRVLALKQLKKLEGW